MDNECRMKLALLLLGFSVHQRVPSGTRICIRTWMNTTESQ